MNQLRSALRQIVGQLCWGVVAGEGTGSVVGIDFGAKVRRRTPVANPHLTAEQREHVGEFSLLVQCVWRLDSDTGVICGCWESYAPDGPVLAALNQLVGQRIEAVRIMSPAWDLLVHFSNQVTWRVFCDQTDPEQATDNYTVFVPGKAFTVAPRSVIHASKSDPAAM